MQKIGSGWFYDVFDKGDGRVLKKRRTFTSMKNRFSRTNLLSTITNWFRGYNYAMRSVWITGRMKVRIQSNAGLRRLLANPVFVGDVDYEQDKVTILKDALTGDIESDAALIDRYIQTIIESWRYGFADTVFKFVDNTGITMHGDMVLIDFNEVTFSVSEVRNDIVQKRWKSSDSLRKISAELKRYFFEQMDTHITLEALEKYWNTSR